MVQKIWKLAGGQTFTPKPFGIMGIVNITPDSFSDGGKYAESEKALQHAHSLWQEGAHFLDLGAESSRPGARALTGEEELERLLPVLTPLLAELEQARAQNAKAEPLPHCAVNFSVADDGEATRCILPPPLPKPEMQVPFISVDTYHAHTAEAVLKAGVHVLNDISGCLFEPELLDVVAEYKPGYVLMHSSARPEVMQQFTQYNNVVDDIRLFFELQLKRLTDAGLPEDHIILDPGIGFGKSLEHNWEILQQISALEKFGRPILGAISMKSLLHGLLNLDPQDYEARAQATQTLTATLALQGVAYHRVHHVERSVRTLRIAQTLGRWY